MMKDRYKKLFVRTEKLLFPDRELELNINGLSVPDLAVLLPLTEKASKAEGDERYSLNGQAVKFVVRKQMIVNYPDMTDEEFESIYNDLGTDVVLKIFNKTKEISGIKDAEEKSEKN